MAPLAKRTSKVNAPKGYTPEQERKILLDLTKEAKGTTVSLQPVADAASSVVAVDQHSIEVSAHDTAFVAELIKIMDAPSIVKRGPCVLLDRWLVAEQDMNIFPVVGSKYNKNINTPYDLRAIRTKKADGTPDIKWASWYGDAALTGARGWIDDMLDTMSDNLNPNWHLSQCDKADKTVPATGIYAHLASNAQELKAMRSYWKDKRSAALNAVKKAVRMYHQMALINAMDNVTAEFAVTQIRNKQGELETVLSTTNAPIMILDRKKRESNYQLTVSAFLGLHPYGAMIQEDAVKGVPGDLVPDPFAAKRDATVIELRNTGNKGADEEGEDAESNPDGDDGLIKTIPGVFGEITRLENFIDDADKSVLLHKALSAKGADADHRVTQLIEFAATINNLAAPYRARFAEIKASVQPKAKTA